jgi:hypothetical protein
MRARARATHICLIMLLSLLNVRIPYLQAQTVPSPGPAWTQLVPAGLPPNPREFSSGIFDKTSDRMTIFGGALQGQGTLLNDTWVLTNADGGGQGTPTWTQLNPTGTLPGVRLFHSAVYDPNTNRMMIFGGYSAPGQCFHVFNDVWVLTSPNGAPGQQWTQLSPTGSLPSPRRDHSAVYDPNTNRMIVFGGDSACQPPTNDVWVLSNANGSGGALTWTQLAPVQYTIPRQTV